MRSIHSAAAVAVAVAAIVSGSPRAETAGANKQMPGRHLVVTNATFDSVTGLSIAPDGTDAYSVIDIGEPLQGGETSITIDVPPGDCLRTVRANFRDGRSQRFLHIDLCSSQHLRLMTGDKREPDQYMAASQ